MQEKLIINQPIIVEGKYDKIKLESFIDGVIIPVHGFSIFTDNPLKELIVSLAKEKGIIVLMDSDAAGFKIRGHISGLADKEQITHVYIPDILGKEKRKSTPSKEGTLGVEGVEIALLKECFEKAGVFSQKREKKTPITKTDFYLAGFTGSADSSKKRKSLYKKLGFPEKISTNSALDILNSIMDLEQFIKLTEEL